MRIVIWDNLDTKSQQSVLTRPSAVANDRLIHSVDSILKAVRADGDAALRAYTKRFDGVDITDLKVPQAAMKAAWDALAAPDKAALQTAKANIEVFHKAQLPKAFEVETMPGVMCRREPRPIDSAGLYIPGGSAPLVSTLLMLAIPAKIAGVPKRIAITPPGRDGKVNRYILAAAYLCGIEDLYIGGGAQAIAALGYGTQTIPKCAKIFGPGNAYVAQAKAQISTEMGGPAIDLPAGPSEAMVLADDQANPVFVASDLLSQAEHDPLAQVMCVCASQEFARALALEIASQLESLPRKDIAAQALANGYILIAPERGTMIEIANDYAPEHLIVQVQNPQDILPEVRNAGSVFLGPWTPEAVGDYASGTNHTLPTYGAARSFSGVGTESFMKFISVQTLTRKGLENIGPCVERLASMEGLEAHRRAISLRLKSGAST